MVIPIDCMQLIKSLTILSLLIRSSNVYNRSRPQNVTNQLGENRHQNREPSNNFLVGMNSLGIHFKKLKSSVHRKQCPRRLTNNTVPLCDSHLLAWNLLSFDQNISKNYYEKMSMGWLMCVILIFYMKGRYIPVISIPPAVTICCT